MVQRALGRSSGECEERVVCGLGVGCLCWKERWVKLDMGVSTWRFGVSTLSQHTK